MSKFERIFYVVVILAMLALVILFYLRSMDTRQLENKNARNSSLQGQRLFSFKGESPTGEKTFIHFTAYSPKYYIILSSSAECPHCLSMIQDMQSFNPGHKLLENVFIYLITTDEFPDPLPPKISQIKALKVSFNDWYQFGMETPSGKILNGKGDVIAHWNGYTPEVLDNALQAIQNHKNTNTKSIQVNPD